jgi:triosephosphate isomerase (TIM)
MGYFARRFNLMRKKLVAGNWKMNGLLASNALLLADLSKAVPTALNAQLAVCVPYPYLFQAAAALTGTPISLGAQDVSEQLKGAFTGEVSGAMLADFGCRYVLVGHSERRSLYGDTNEFVAAKFAAAQAAGLTPILCVGETLAEREAGVTMQVITKQLEAVLAKSGIAALSAAVIAYEPVWAIGTGRTASPDQAQEVHAQIRARIEQDHSAVAADVQILYGGSMKPENAAELMRQKDIDGGLIGGASLIADDFLAIARAA